MRTSQGGRERAVASEAWAVLKETEEQRQTRLLIERYMTWLDEAMVKKLRPSDVMRPFLTKTTAKANV